MTSDTASVSTEEGNSNSSFPPPSVSVPVTPASTPLSTPLPLEDNDGGAFKYVKTKKVIILGLFFLFCFVGEFVSVRGVILKILIYEFRNLK